MASIQLRARTKRKGFTLRGRRQTGVAPLLAPPLTAVLILLLAPLLFVFTTALGDGIGRVSDVLTSRIFVQSVVQTLLLAAVVTGLCVVFGLLYATAALLAGPATGRVLLGVLVASFWISLIARTYGWVLLLQPRGIMYDALSSVTGRQEPLGIYHSKPAMYIGMVHIMLPYLVLPVYAAMTKLDPSQIAAARSLGAKAHTTYFRVVLPALRPSLMAGGALVFIISLTFFITPAFLGGPSELTVATVIHREFGALYDFTSASIMSAAVLIAVGITYALVEKRWGVTRQLY